LSWVSKRCRSNHALIDQRKSVSNCSSAIFRDLSFVCLIQTGGRIFQLLISLIGTIVPISLAPTKQTHGAGKEETCCALARRR